MKFFKYMSVALAIAGLTSCSSDYLDTEDHSSMSAETAGEVAAKQPSAFLNGIWTWNVSQNVSTDHDDFGFMSTLLCFEVESEDIAFSASHYFIYDYELDYRLEQWVRARQHWARFYTNIAKANEIISLYPNGPQTKAEKVLVGQALAMRGFSYTYLIQIFQDYMTEDGEAIRKDAPGVPIMMTAADGCSADEIAALKGRNTVGKVMEVAEKDLTNAVKYLEDAETDSQYKRSTSDPNAKDCIDAGVANGMLARYYLLAREWQKAADAAHAARKGYTQRGKDELLDGFMDVTQCDVMWGFNHTTETSTVYASFFSHMSSYTPGYGGLGYCTKLIDARLYSQIPDDDYRKVLFNGEEGDNTAPSKGAQLPYANLKFGDDGQWTMDYIYMRAAEMALIEAEAYVRLNKQDKAIDAMKELMEKRQPGWNKSKLTLDEVLLQRRIELWGEGFAFFDLKRNNRGINRDYEGSNHLAGHKLVVPAHDVLWTYQLPINEIQENSLINEEDQNP